MGQRLEQKQSTSNLLSQKERKVYNQGSKRKGRDGMIIPKSIEELADYAQKGKNVFFFYR